MAVEPFIPEYITVHLGPPNSSAENIRVPFIDYIKNVVSSEIYPTWDEEAIRANALAAISYAVNRVYVEYYRSRGYDFDITNSTAIDQSYVKGRDVFDTISRVVDDVFTSYIRREGFIEPLAAKYCNGTTTTCEGLSQWGSQQLAQEGRTALEILRTYYGDDIELVENALVQEVPESYPGTPLRKGDSGSIIKDIQFQLNTIGDAYPSIPKISPIDGEFDDTTEEAVRRFQDIFNLTVDGVVGPATWYEIIRVFTGILNLSELRSEGLTPERIQLDFVGDADIGTENVQVETAQFFLNVLAAYYPSISAIPNNGIYDQDTKNQVIAFQQLAGLPATGILDMQTYFELYEYFQNILDGEFTNPFINIAAPQIVPYDGEELRTRSFGDRVALLQQYLNTISNEYPSIPKINVTGVFGRRTAEAVNEFQRIFGLTRTSKVEQQDWDRIIEIYRQVSSQMPVAMTQFSGKINI